MGFIVTKQPNPADKTIAPTTRVHGTTLKPSPASKRRKGNAPAFHKPRQAGTSRPFGPQ